MSEEKNEYLLFSISADKEEKRYDPALLALGKIVDAIRYDGFITERLGKEHIFNLMEYSFTVAEFAFLLGARANATISKKENTVTYRFFEPKYPLSTISLDRLCVLYKETESMQLISKDETGCILSVTRPLYTRTSYSGMGF